MKHKCNKCKEEKELNEDNFHKDTRYSVKNFRKTCKKCISERQKVVYEEKKQNAFF